MIYATRIDNMTIVAAATDIVELESFYERIFHDPVKLYTKEWQPNISEMMEDANLVQFRKPPYLFEHIDGSQADEFETVNEIKIVSVYALVNKQRSMLDAVQIDTYVGANADHRSLAEIYDLEKDDPWSVLTPEMAAKQEEFKKIAEEAKKKGKLTDESFKDPAASGVRVTDIKTVKHTDGSQEITSVLAVKGLHDNNGMSEEEIAARDGKASEVAPVVDAEEVLYKFKLVEQDCDCIEPILLEANGYQWDIIFFHDDDSFIVRGEKEANKIAGSLDRNKIGFKATLVNSKKKKVGKFVRNDALAQEIDVHGQIAIYYRIDVQGRYLWELDDEMPDGGKLRDTVVASGEFGWGSWVACSTQMVADKIAAHWSDFDVEIYAVNDAGERLLPKGSSASIVDQNAPTDILPRPWNAKASEIDLMDEEQLKVHKKSIKADEFIYCGTYNDAHTGCVLYVCPKSYFLETGEMYDGKLDIAHLLPGDLKEISNGVYNTKSQTWANLASVLGQKGFRENLMFQLYLNSL